MAYSLIIHDKPDAGTIERRLAVRDSHIAKVRELQKSGVIHSGGAMLNEDGAMVGSVLLVNLATKAECIALIQSDIYYKEGVWGDYQILEIKILPDPK